MPQGSTGPSRPAPARHRPGQQRRGPFADERRPEREPVSHSPDRPRHNGGLLKTDDDLRGQLDRPTAAVKAGDLDTERRQQSELTRLREEVLDIARELTSLRRRKSGRSGAADFAAKPARLETTRETAAKAKPSGMSRNGKFAPGTRPGTKQKYHGPFTARDVPSNPAQVHSSPAAELRGRPYEQRPLVRDGKRHQPVDPAHRNPRVGTVDPATRAAPARAEAPPPLTSAGEPLRRAPVKPRNPAKRTNGRGLSLGAKAALLAVLMLAGTGLITMKLWDEMPWLALARQKVADMLVLVSWPMAAAKQGQQAQSHLAAPARQLPPAYPFAIPDTYGVYAISDGNLTPLEPLPIRVPDARVSISSTISKPAPAPIMNGRLFFVVYHRELATSVPEAASVRIVARVMQATTFVGGKPKSIAAEDIWAVRGGSIDLRIAPVPGSQEMIVIRPADPNFALSPGRYVLMFKNQAYDFSVAGTVSDTAQCLERANLQDRSVFSECRELPAQPVNF